MFASACNVDIPPMTFVGLSEINFKYEDGDYIEFYVNKPDNIDVNALEVIVDGKNVYDGGDLHEFNLIKYDLVSTTEQVLVSYGGTIIDGFCWKSGSVSQSEVEDLKEFEELELGECWNSGELINGGHFIRDDYLEYEGWTVGVMDTPGEKNELEIAPPEAFIEIQSGELLGYENIKINFDGRQSYDEYGLDLEYYWDFGNGEFSEKANPTEITYNEVGNYVVELKVSNTVGHTDKDYAYVSVLPKFEIESQSEIEEGESYSSQSESDELKAPLEESLVVLSIHDFMANPEGSDTGKEWIEIYNQGEAGFAVGWTLDDVDGGSTPFNLDAVYFEENEKVKLYNSETRVNLNNSNEKVRLFSRERLVNEIEYKIAKSGVSYLNLLNEETEESPEDEEINIEELTNGTNLTSNYNAVRITEVLPNPEGNDSGNEWVEIWNFGEQEVSLEDWVIQVNKKKVTMENISLKPGNYKAIDLTGVSNSGGTIALYNSAENKVDELVYSDVVEGNSYSLMGDKWIWSEFLSKGSLNPKVEFIQEIVIDHLEVDQKLVFENVEIFYDSLDVLIEQGDMVKVEYIVDVLLSIEKVMDDDLATGGILKNESNVEAPKLGYKIWVYIGIYILSSIIAFAFRKPLLRFMKTKLQEV